MRQSRPRARRKSKRSRSRAAVRDGHLRRGRRSDEAAGRAGALRTDARRLSENSGSSASTWPPRPPRSGPGPDRDDALIRRPGQRRIRADQLDEKAWGWLTGRMSYLQGDLTDAGLLSAGSASIWRNSTRRRHRGQLSVLSRHCRSFLQRGGRGPRGCGPGRKRRRAMAPRRDREAVRPRPCCRRRR